MSSRVWPPMLVDIRRPRRGRLYPRAPLHAGDPAARDLLAPDGRLLEDERRHLGVLDQERAGRGGRLPPEHTLQEADAREHHAEQAVVVAHALVQLPAEVQHLDLGRVPARRLEHVDRHAGDLLLEVVEEEPVGADVHVDIELVLDQPGAQVLPFDPSQFRKIWRRRR